MQEEPNTAKRLWFKRKLYGWGWYPVSWQGWLATAIYVAVIFAAASTVEDDSPAREVALTFLLPVALVTAAFICIAYRTGEKPRWQWGKDRGDGSNGI